MKKLVSLTVLVFLSLGLFAQMKYQPEVIVIFKGEKNATFDESKYPDLKFYYLPGLEKDEIVENTEKNTTINAALSVTGISSSTSPVAFKGEPAIFNTVIMDGSYVFDKTGLISGYTKDLGMVRTSARKNLQGQYDYSNLKSISKDFIKKGKTAKPAKKKLKKSMWDQYWSLTDYIGRTMPEDFQVQDAEGKSYSFNELVSANNMTLVHFTHLNKNFDLNKGKESGEGKTGKAYAKEVLATVAGDAQLESIKALESVVFGLRIRD